MSDTVEDTPGITETPTVSDPAGVPDGTVLDTRHPDGTTSKEVVVNDLDADGNVIGFHKEVVNG